MAIQYNKRYTALYDDKLLIALVMYGVNEFGEISKKLDVFCEKDMKNTLIEKLSYIEPLPFSPIDYTYLEEKLIVAYSRNADSVLSFVHGELISGIKNITQIKNRIIQQENKKLVRFRVKWQIKN